MLGCWGVSCATRSVRGWEGEEGCVEGNQSEKTWGYVCARLSQSACFPNEIHALRKRPGFSALSIPPFPLPSLTRHPLPTEKSESTLLVEWA